jgi:hypothetical protein
MATSRWATPESVQSYLTAELNGLADGANKIGAEIANEADKYLYVNVELYVAAQGSARDSGAYVALYLVPALDGTNYSYGDDSTDPPAHALIGQFLLDAATTARRVTLENLLIPPLDFKLLVMNETGQAFAANGNTLKYRRHNGDVS